MRCIRLFFVTLLAFTSISIITTFAYTIKLIDQAQHFAKKTSKKPWNNKFSKKIFMLTGEVSGDKLGAWYLRKIKESRGSASCQALGNKFLQKEGAQLLKNFDELYVGNGLASLINTLPRQLTHFNNLVDYVLKNNFAEVVLVDFPLINIPFARALKLAQPTINITFIAPPELWFWGTWHLDDFLKAYCDTIIVLYPYEVTWYQSIGMNVTWLGYPYRDEFELSLHKQTPKEKMIALLPGSRAGELKTMMPLFIDFIKQFSEQFPDVQYIFPVAASFEPSMLQYYLDQANINTSLISIIHDETEKKEALTRCCLVISKPGTVTLELALLNVPSIVTYKVSWLTYVLTKLFINPSAISLPNLLSSQKICTELLQTECNATAICKQAALLYTGFLENNSLYQRKLCDLEEFSNIFVSQKNYANQKSHTEKTTLVPQALF
ncbi:hypothetical protein IPF37_02680 [bacterium]|nr:MAG: hypothetical protein IPF37_02680 [bacterium]